MFPKRFLLATLATLGLALQWGCIASGTSTDGTALYVFDSDAATIRVWDDLPSLYATPNTAYTRSLTSTYLSDVTPLAWGGMAMDRVRGRLWLVSETGLVARIDSVRSRSGALSTSYIRTFQLGSDDSDRISEGVFGQAAVDQSTGALYVTEYSASTCRVWVLATPTAYGQSDTVASSSATLLHVTGDKYGYGVAVGASSRLFAYCDGGTTITDGNNTEYTGARLRMGTASGGFSRVIVGSSGLDAYGLLGADASNNLLYLARYDNSSDPIAVYATSQFTTGYDAAPKATLPGNSSYPIRARVIAHGVNKDWLVATGAGTASGDYANQIHLWKAPSTDTTSEPQVVLYNSVTTSTSSQTILRGIALDGAASSD